MSDEYEKYRRKVATFRFDAISDRIHRPAPGTTLAKQISEKARKSYATLGNRRTKVAETTIRSWLRDYRRGQIGALFAQDPQGRRSAAAHDCRDGQHASVSQARRSAPERDRRDKRPAPGLILAPMPHLTVHRQYEQHGTSRPPGDPP